MGEHDLVSRTVTGASGAAAAGSGGTTVEGGGDLAHRRTSITFEVQTNAWFTVLRSHEKRAGSQLRRGKNILTAARLLHYTEPAL